MAIRGVIRQQGTFNKIATDERFSGSIRALSACISLWLAADGDDKNDIRDFIKGAFNRTSALKQPPPQVLDKISSAQTATDTKSELKTLANVKEALGSMYENPLEDDNTEGEDSE